MKKLIVMILCFCLIRSLTAQIIFVDPVHGDDLNSGTKDSPLKNLETAVVKANSLAVDSSATIKLFPGLYLLHGKIILQRKEGGLLIEALTLPGEKDWDPYKMPVISSISDNNSTIQFPHSTGILVAMDDVQIKGLKFTGNANPAVRYYYPISKKDTVRTGLEISQCYFIGERNVAPIQGAIWVHGAGTHVDHCIFYECKNALLLFDHIKDFALTNSIIYGAYEAAVWFGPFVSEFTFKNNVISGCNFVWLRKESTYPKYVFQNSLFAGNKNFMGYYAKNGLQVADRNEHVEKGIVQSAEKVNLKTVEQNGLFDGYLHLLDNTIGADLKSGIYTEKN
ncbi:right-handed parallel beta-helix repeat-containing protein [Sphingobacterium sp. WOUb80]|uniref:right-handed parallel beta-helix repeat-containing protein n=1 Tax=Sphingobacterium sp. WOUb80 TaxID=3234028 RepID=UPI003CEA4871